MFQHHTWRGAAATCVVGDRALKGAPATARRVICPCSRSTRAKVDSLAMYTPSSVIGVDVETPERWRSDALPPWWLTHLFIGDFLKTLRQQRRSRQEKISEM
ncbi:hypothetical protein H3V53_28895 [Paraburkholderia bengalensis]|uniref:Uncharacterized protein n=1 Tax=Paraburkholderia bengalensis TaxID=2747562 RepID=A0ABU8J0N8_9BURK